MLTENILLKSSTNSQMHVKKKKKSISRLKVKNKNKGKTCKGVRSCGEKHTNNTTLPNIYKVI